MSKELDTGKLEFYRVRHGIETPLTLRVLLPLASGDLSYRPHERSASAGDIFWTIVNGLSIRNDLVANLDADTSSGPASSYAILLRQFEDLSSALSDKLGT